MQKIQQKIFFFLTLTFLITHVSFAQHVIKGKVKDAQNQPLEFVVVKLTNKDGDKNVNGKLTDERGEFTFKKIKKGSYLLNLQSVGFEEFQKEIVLKNDQSDVDLGAIVLQDKLNELGQVVVKAKKPLIKNKLGKITMNIAESTLSSGLSAQEALRYAPGVVVSSEEQITINGKGNILVLIDGRETRMDLNSLQTDQIESIDIISNPGVEYDADAQVIVDIKLKKIKSRGIQGDIGFSTRQGIYGRYSGNFNFAYKSNKLNFYITSNNNRNRVYNQFHFDTKYLSSSPIKISETDFDYDYNNRRAYVNTGLSYQLSDRTELGIIYEGSPIASNNDLTNGNIAFGIENADKNKFTNHYSELEARNNDHSYNLHLIHKIDSLGKELKWAVDYYHIRTKNDTQLRTEEENRSGSTPINTLVNQQSNQPVYNQIVSSKLDYNHPINGKTQFKAGLKYSFVEIQNNIDFFKLNSQQEWEKLGPFSSVFNYKENILAAYLKFAKSIGKVSLDLGVRIENSTIAIRGSNDTNDFSDMSNKTNIFPSISVNWAKSANYNLSFSYSRKIRRPEYLSLNEARFYVNPYEYIQGSKDLLPLMSDSFVLSNQIYRRFNLTFFADIKRNEIVRITDQDDDTTTTRLVSYNLPNSFEGGANISLPFEIKKWWNVNLNATMLYRSNKGEVDVKDPNTGEIEAKKFDLNIFGQFINLNQSFLLPRDFSLELTSYYQSPFIWSFFLISESYQFNINLKKSLFNNKLDVKVGVNDIFRTFTNDVVVKFENQERYVYQYRDSHYLTVSLKYKFKKGEKVRRKRGYKSNEEEKGRL